MSFVRTNTLFSLMQPAPLTGTATIDSLIHVTSSHSGMQPAPLTGTATTVELHEGMKFKHDATRTPYGDGNLLLRLMA